MTRKYLATILLLVASALAASVANGAEYINNDNANPVANPAAVVVSGNARFTVLTDRLIRMEWAEDGVFEDRGSLAIINRNLPVPEFTAESYENGVVIKTGKVVLCYKGDGKFNAGNLSVSFKLNGKKVVWTPGADDSGNLKGTARTLDGFSGKGEGKILNRDNVTELENGIISRDGWAIVDESARHLFEPTDNGWTNWVASRPAGDRQDLYIFAYGHDYKAALYDYTRIAGNIPLPPKYAFGYWWSRFWAYTDQEMLDIAKELRDHDVPADVFIIDMDWHETWWKMGGRLGNDELGEGRGWTGYTWNRTLIPDPEGFLYDLHAMGYKTSLNLHPADGIRPYEEPYSRFVKDFLSRTDKYDGPEGYVWGDEDYQYRNYKGRATVRLPKGHRATVPYQMTNPAWADAYFNSVLHPIQSMGVDFWWLDWQQWRTSRYVEGLSNTFWINYIFWKDSDMNTDHRPFIYHRWGGLGAHRYQVGFSGDTQTLWAVLDYLPYFTSTASNVGYGYWGHDIGGHYYPEDTPAEDKKVNPEMFTRWLQFGVFTPIFKTHSTAEASLERRIWMFPEYYDNMKAAVKLRYALSPYIYTAAREAFDTGISLCRPLYYNYPEDSNAYDFQNEYMFGPDILATVVSSPADSLSGKAQCTIWFPAGNDWYDMASHKLMRGGKTCTLGYTIDQNPWYVRAGAIIPLASNNLRNLQDPNNELRLLVVPGTSKSSCRLYEDDGNCKDYESNCSWTTFTKYASGRSITIVAGAREGTFDGASPIRNLSIILEGVSSDIMSVSVNGTPVQAQTSNDGSSSTVAVGEIPADKETSIKIQW